MRINKSQKNLTQQQLAEKIGVTRQTIGLIEKGKYNPSIILCIKIAKVLDKTLDDLFWEVERSDKT
ncbi:helix-turn-helix transcriptional regulator [Clostridium botulinum]|uniref:helix-turn-helix transcriptional regulator n=1 Tax=unclassified Clostridium TaxID=2614128 RepID=UPI0005009FE3|nr:Cro/Cl family transcriptional regulator [Clostridium botulinum]MBY6780755.1 helix-turn-helix transcriptional regulator [Clostridium botulinum]MBY6853940.1 helix-turn-helix transcriptional regulator [Clostridium botulinum]MBY7009523.1 helix-turn-helix transcriptional regulator [Clostridium botulinum]NFF24552.1 helix-turn-helix transcriptional regulator [Clostridium botulinum]